MYVSHICKGVFGVQRRALYPLELELQPIVSLHVGCSEKASSSLTTEPSHQPCVNSFFCGTVRIILTGLFQKAHVCLKTGCGVTWKSWGSPCIYE